MQLFFTPPLASKRTVTGDFAKEFPVLFPNENLTRKQHVLSLILPKYLRQGTCYRMMKVEQMMESLHAQHNKMEKKRKNERNRAKRFYQMIKAHENKLKSNRTNFEKKLKYYHMFMGRFFSRMILKFWW